LKEGYNNMDVYKKCLKVMEELFEKDYQFAFATSKDNIPSVRFVDTLYDNESFYIVTYNRSQKVRELELNQNVCLCNKLYSFSGVAHNIGHPSRPENSVIRSKLVKAFEAWYFKHNNEDDENMCYVKVDLIHGFFYKDGIGYKVDFTTQEVTEFPFESDIVLLE
jgi:uncharacterized pyridoxamine 5'-phosphate oxidase family protein